MSATTSFWICLSCAVVFSACAFLEVRAVTRLRRDGVRTSGTVIDNVRDPSKPRRSQWTPVIEFTDSEGYRVEFAPRARSGRRMPLGRTVNVIFLPDRPIAARMNTWSDLWLLTTFLTVFLMGLGTALIDLGMQIAAQGGM